MNNFYCQQVCGEVDFDISKHNALLEEVYKMPIPNSEMEKIINGEPCKKQCFECIAIVGETRIKNKLIREKQKPTLNTLL